MARDVLRPFFSYYGSKWGIAHLYPGPRHRSDLVVEPFAGSASYALHHYGNRVRLVDSNEVVAGVWDYLIKTPSREILALRAPVEGVDDLGDVCQEARWLVGFWLGRGECSPRKTLSAWGRTGRWPWCFWGELVRDRVAQQVDLIRHWEVRLGDYRQECSEESATWFVDPPYEVQGRHYRRFGVIDRGVLAAWCRRRHGKVIVCENDGATWLPFEHLVTSRANHSRGSGRTTREMIWISEDGRQA